MMLQTWAYYKHVDFVLSKKSMYNTYNGPWNKIGALEGNLGDGVSEILVYAFSLKWHGSFDIFNVRIYVVFIVNW